MEEDKSVDTTTKVHRKNWFCWWIFFFFVKSYRSFKVKSEKLCNPQMN